MRFTGFRAAALFALAAAVWNPGGPAQAAQAAQGTMAGSAAAMRDRYAALEPVFRQNALNRQAALESAEEDSNVRGDIWGVIDQRYTQFSEAMGKPDRWCEVLILHVHTRYCNARRREDGQSMLVVYNGTKPDPALGSAHRVEFTPQPMVRTADYFQSVLLAPNGPMGTRDYRIVLEAIPLPGNKTFVHLSYTYGAGFAGRLAIKAYLMTIGAGKVGFTRNPDGSFIGGARGIVERNVMRYFLAIEAYLTLPERESLDERLLYWWDASEMYPKQLHELDRVPYLELKRREYGRQLMD